MRKIATLGIVLLLAAIPWIANIHPAYAQAPAITASPASAAVGTTITVTGTGFPDDVDITLTLFDGTTETTLAQILQSRGGVAAGTVRADANGFFKTGFEVPNLPGGTYTLRARTPVAILATTSFRIEPSIELLDPTFFFSGIDVPVTSGFARADHMDSGTRVIMRLRGWARDETVIITGLPFIFSGTEIPLTTLTLPVGSAILDLRVGFASGGLKLVSVIGTSGVKSANFTVLPRIVLYSSQTDTTTRFSIRGTPPTSVLLEGHGFPPGVTIGANTITVAGVTGTHVDIPVGADGRFGRFGARPEVFITTALPLGPTSMVIGGATFSFAGANIFHPGALASRGALIVSVPATSAIINLDRTSYSPGLHRIWVFGFGFPANNGAVSISTNATIPATPAFTVVGASTDTNGAVLAFSGAALGDNSFDRYVVTETGTGVGVQPGFFTILPRLVRSTDFADSTTEVTITGRGFKNGETVTVTIAGVSFGTVTVGPPTFPAGRWAVTAVLPPVPFGSQTFRATSPSATATTSIFVLTSVTPGAINPNFIAPGETATLLPGRITGLKASTTYQITLGAHTGAPVLREFTSDTRGRNPAVSFPIPLANSETHIVDIREKATGASAIYGNLLTLGPQYTDLLIFVKGALTASPRSGGVDTRVSLTADNLRAGKEYQIWLLRGVTLLAALTFTATSDGKIPAGTTISIPETFTVDELGTQLTFWLLRDLPPLTVVGEATFTFFATATLDKTEAAPGDLITITAKGLAAGQLYRIYIDFVSPASPGVLVGTLISDAAGTGSAAFIVPDGLTTGSHKVQLVRQVAGVDSPRLVSPPSFTLKAAVGVFDSTSFKQSAKTDKPSYRVGEEFKVSFLLKTTTGAAKFDYVVTVKDPDGRVLYPISAATGISVDTTGTTITVTYAVPTGAKAGTWTASIVILQAGAVVDVAVITFTVS